MPPLCHLPFSYLVSEIYFISAYTDLARSGFFQNEIFSYVPCVHIHVQGFSRVDASRVTGSWGHAPSIIIDAAKALVPPHPRQHLIRLHFNIFTDRMVKSSVSSVCVPRPVNNCLTDAAKGISQIFQSWPTITHGYCHWSEPTPLQVFVWQCFTVMEKYYLEQKKNNLYFLEKERQWLSCD